MQELFPLELTLSFQTKIISSRFITKINHKAFYHCHTNFGIMTLISQEVTKDNLVFSNSNEINVENHSIESPQHKLLKRKQFLISYPFCTVIPVIYQQLIIPSHKDRAVCLTLIQPIQILTYQQYHQKVNIELQRSLMLAVQYVSQTTQWNLKLFNQKNMKQMVLFKSILGGQLFLDFTQLQMRQKQFKKIYNPFLIGNFLKELNFYYPINQSQNQLKKIILIKDRLYKISKQKLITRQFTSWHQVCICFNFLMQEQVMVKIKQNNSKGESIQRTKRTQLKSISSSQPQIPIEIFNCKDKISLGQYHFYDGYSTDLLQVVEYDELLKGFFIDNSTYFLKKDTYLWIQRVENILQKHQDLKKSNNKSDTILIQEGVQKWECINFFITYCKFVEPTLKRIYYVKEENSLHFQFLGKWKVQRQLRLVFGPSYVIKDEQLSMIIEKSRIEDLTLELSGMSITDSFLMFLANSQKMSKIKNLDISYCLKVTQNGVNSLLISPFCKSLHVINVSGTPIVQSSIESLLKKGQLKDLIMNNCPIEDSIEYNNFLIRNSKLTKLQAIGMNVTGSFGSSLKILKIGTYLPLEFLKELKDMPLKELAIRLVQQKKNLIGGLMGTIGTFYSSKETNPIKSFTQGTIASKNIKFLDLSQSLTKLKTLKHLFMMPQLEILKLENLSSTQQIDFSISQKIIDLSFKNTEISVRDLNQLIKSTKILLKLNISNTIIQKSQIVEFLKIGKKYVNTLVISQNQYSMNLIDPNGKASQFVETFEIDCNSDFFKLKNEKLLSNMIYKTFRSSKNLKFRTNSQSQSIGFLSKFINWFNLDSARNIFINDRQYRLVYENMRQRQQRQKKINCGQFLRVNMKHKKPITIPLESQGKITQSFQQDETSFNNQLTNFLYLYRKTVLEYPESTIQISLRENKVINCVDVISLIKSYSQHHHIKSIDFRGCTLLSHNILPKIIEIPLIESYNHNQYQVFLDQKNFSELSQKYLKFFMRISSIKKLKLQCKYVNQTELLFSIFFHVFDYHYESIQELDLNLQGIAMSRQNSTNFWVKLIELKKLKSLKIKINRCPTAFLKRIFEQNQLNQSRHLETLSIEGIDYVSLYALQNGYSVRNLAMNFQNSTITQTHLLKLLKPFGPSLISLQLNLSRCDQFTLPNKIFTLLGEFKSLQSFNISFQYCPLKELSTIDFLENLYSLKKLRQLQIDLSFTGITFNSIANVVSQLPIKLSKCHVSLYLVGNQSKQTQIDREALQAQGLQIVL